MQQNDLTKSLVELFCIWLLKGLYPLHISNITLMRVDHSTQPVAVCQKEPSIVLVIQGVKRAYIGKDIFKFQQGQCLFISIAIPFDCDTLVEREPMLAIAIKFEPQMMAELATKWIKSTDHIEDFDNKEIKLSCG